MTEAGVEVDLGSGAEGHGAGPVHTIQYLNYHYIANNGQYSSLWAKLYQRNGKIELNLYSTPIGKKTEKGRSLLYK